MFDGNGPRRINITVQPFTIIIARGKGPIGSCRISLGHSIRRKSRRLEAAIVGKTISSRSLFSQSAPTPVPRVPTRASTQQDLDRNDDSKSNSFRDKFRLNSNSALGDKRCKPTSHASRSEVNDADHRLDTSAFFSLFRRFFLPIFLLLQRAFFSLFLFLFFFCGPESVILTYLESHCVTVSGDKYRA